MTSVAVDSLQHLAPVALEDLVAEAGLLARIDRKYVVPVDEAWQLLADVPRATQVLEIDGRREFGYDSTYLDTPDLTSFLSSGRSRRRRWKVRTRSYLDTGGTWLEVKTRGSRGHTVKQRIAHPSRRWLTEDGDRFVADIVGGRVTDALSPVLTTTYRRTTLFLPWSTARVTIDVDLGWTSLLAGGQLSLPGLAIVETKTGSTPSDADRLLWSHGHRPVRISKYGVGMAALHPELPRLKWHRAMHRHLALPPTDVSLRGALR